MNIAWNSDEQTGESTSMHVSPFATTANTTTTPLPSASVLIEARPDVSAIWRHRKLPQTPTVDDYRLNRTSCPSPTLLLLRVLAQMPEARPPSIPRAGVFHPRPRRAGPWKNLFP